MSSRHSAVGRLGSVLAGAVLTAIGGLSAPAQVPVSLSIMALATVGASVTSAPASAATVAKNNIVELSPTPPNVTQAVPPNIVVTFDDSGSMAWNYMGDERPFDSVPVAWGNNRWRCAGVIDPRVTDASNLRSLAMNGVFYNPNVTYSPPLYADGTEFPKADATLKSVWNDGIVANRPRSPSGSSNTTDFTGVKPKSGTDKRWVCPNSGESSSPLNDGGPYYYRVVSTTNIGSIASPSLNNLYAKNNWEAVAVPPDQYQNWANWWAYYRTRNLMTQTSVSRVFGTLGAETESGGFGNNIRVAWQNLNDGNFNLPASTIITSLIDAAGCRASAIDPKATQQVGGVKTAPGCYRSAFFNWIFQVGSADATPNRASTIRAGDFFQRGKGNTGGTGDLRDPYWNPPAVTGADGLELVCRQNYHMLVTDGYWNESDPKTLPTPFQTSQSNVAGGLPDGTPYSTTAPESRVYWNVQGTEYKSSLANIAFNYWATNLRPDLYDPANGKIVPPYVPDSTTGVVPGATSLALEKYFNPKNDPANWPHLVQYMVTLGVPGKLTASDDANCDDPTNDLCKLRKGLTNSSGATGWTRPANNAAVGIDDTWHAAVNSRGGYFNAANPQNLVDQLSSILTNISARNVPATTSALNTSVLVQGALGFSAGYSSGDWSGVFQAISANTDGTVSGLQWDAAAILTDATKTDPAARQILTSKKGTGGRVSGVAFRNFGDLDSGAQVLTADSPSRTLPSDTGQARIDYLRGVRTLEGSTYRTRTNLLGAVINSQAAYVGTPSSGYRNSWPAGSPEQLAMANDATTCDSAAPTLATCHSYEAFVHAYRDRNPAAYIGANDGMLHAFNAKMVMNTASPPIAVPAAGAGKEMFAYVPRSIYANLGNLTSKSNMKFAPTVDATPVVRDVYFSVDTSAPVTTKGWRTLLVGGLRLGGRGIYALDITDPATVTEANATSKVLWEFTADMPAISGVGDPADLGYTFGQPNIGRLANGKWVVLVPGGYFPDCSQSAKPVDCTTIAASSKGYSALFVLDAQTGALIRELKTLTTISNVSSGGLSSVVLGDYNDDQIDDVAFAGDLNGNLWRFDLTDSNPANWQSGVTLAFQPAKQGDQPITVMPRLFPDPATNRFIVVFGTGKYLGAKDNTSDSALVQSIYGIRDKVGTTAVRANLQEQKLYQTTSANGVSVVRGLTDRALTTAQGGWYIDLAIADTPGERVVVTPGALFDTNRAVITTLIPGTQDPCSATIGGALMILNAATGGSGGGLAGPPSPSSWGTGVTGVSVVGALVNNPPTGGSVPVATVIGGGNLLVPGLQLKGGGGLNINDAVWRRRSWRELNN